MTNNTVQYNTLQDNSSITSIVQSAGAIIRTGSQERMETDPSDARVSSWVRFFMSMRVRFLDLQARTIWGDRPAGRRRRQGTVPPVCSLLATHRTKIQTICSLLAPRWTQFKQNAHAWLPLDQKQAICSLLARHRTRYKQNSQSWLPIGPGTSKMLTPASPLDQIQAK